MDNFKFMALVITLLLVVNIATLGLENKFVSTDNAATVPPVPQNENDAQFNGRIQAIAILNNVI